MWAVLLPPGVNPIAVKYIYHIISFKTCTKWERAITRWNPAAQMCPVLDSSSFATILMLPHRTCPHSASSILAVRISCHVIAVFVFRKPLFINTLYCIYVCYMNIMFYIQCSVLSMVSRNRGRSWNVLPTNTGAHLYYKKHSVLHKYRFWYFKI
jgi:hypothetical protein